MTPSLLRMSASISICPLIHFLVTLTISASCLERTTWGVECEISAKPHQALHWQEHHAIRGTGERNNLRVICVAGHYSWGHRALGHAASLQTGLPASRACCQCVLWSKCFGCNSGHAWSILWKWSSYSSETSRKSTASHSLPSSSIVWDFIMQRQEPLPHMLSSIAFGSRAAVHQSQAQETAELHF